MSPINLNFSKLNGLVPAVIQEQSTAQVLMVGFMNELAYRRTMETRQVYFWSRSKNSLWLKGETSGNKLEVISVLTDCDCDTLLVAVKMLGSTVCHTGSKSCFRNQVV
jgi:phosphoribosyl-AMP cyclohydrolase